MYGRQWASEFDQMDCKIGGMKCLENIFGDLANFKSSFQPTSSQF